MTTFTLILSTLAYALLGYLAGSLAFSIWITRLVKGIDVREGGSGHAGTTQTLRQAGFLPALLNLFLDIAKGYLPTWLALQYAPAEAAWIPPITAAMVVVGHCWPVFAGFRGGMGNACAGGCLLAGAPLAFLLALGLVVALTLLTKHTARASLITAVLLPVIYWLLHFDQAVVWIGAALAVVLVIRFAPTWNRKYREVWLDREQAGKK
jgi:acyl phosphate:glycerol-3-phosphate acyltransferase